MFTAALGGKNRQMHGSGGARLPQVFRSMPVGNS